MESLKRALKFQALDTVKGVAVFWVVMLIVDIASYISISRLGCKVTIARIRNPEYMEQLDFIKTELGIDHIINPDLNADRLCV